MDGRPAADTEVRAQRLQQAGPPYDEVEEEAITTTADSSGVFRFDELKTGYYNLALIREDQGAWLHEDINAYDPPDRLVVTLEQIDEVVALEGVHQPVLGLFEL